MKKIDKLISLFFHLLFFFTPIVLFPKTNEIFEFNKIILVYIIAVLIFGLWATKCILAKRVIFRRTLLDIPLALFLVSQIIATVFSIDLWISLLGYYGRFNGGLISITAFAVLYWAYVSNMDRRQSVKSIKLSLASAVLVATIALFEHLGTSLTCILVATTDQSLSSQSLFRFIVSIRQNFDPSCWVQDFQNRAFSTLGQPNWLAAWLVTVIPMTWVFTTNKLRSESDNTWKAAVPVAVSAFLFIGIIFTKSRSGLVGLIVADAVFWGLTIFAAWKNKSRAKILKVFATLHLIAFISASAIGGRAYLMSSSSGLSIQETATEAATDPEIISGISNTLAIRKIVWRGAVDVWKSSPFLGTGVETFGLTYRQFKPAEHNMTIEWNFLFNKAHNEYLNLLANTGVFGLTTYLLLTAASLVKILRFRDFKRPDFNSKDGMKSLVTNLVLGSELRNGKLKTNGILKFGILAGYISILVTNFVSFSVVAVSLFFFLYPALAATLDTTDPAMTKKSNKTSWSQWLGISTVLIGVLLLLKMIAAYWYADYQFVLAQDFENRGQLHESRLKLNHAIKYNKYEPAYWNRLASETSLMALQFAEAGDSQLARVFENSAIKESDTALSLSSNNVSYLAAQAVTFIRLSGIEPSYIKKSEELLALAKDLAPNDVEIIYNLGIARVRTGDIESAIDSFKSAIEKKPNYRDPRYALALLLDQQGKTDEAAEQLEFILKHIDPSDNQAEGKLLEIRGSNTDNDQTSGN